MRLLKYIFGEKEIPFKAPNSWADVPFSTYVAYNKLIESGEADKPSNIYSLFMPEVSSDLWDKPQDPKLFQSIQGQLNFLSEEPSKEVPTHIIHDDYDVITPKTIETVTANQYWGGLKAVDDVLKGKGTDCTTLELMPDLIAILMFKETDKGILDKRIEEIKAMPTDKVYALGCFFLKRLESLKNGTTRICRIKNLMRRILVRVMAEFLTITVILLRLITFRKGCLVSVKLYLTQKLLKCTFKYRYLLIFPSVKGNIQTS